MDHQLDRFLQAQEYCYQQALAEMRGGEKRSHWIWYIFPQLKGLGHSYNSNSNYYGLSGADEANAYLNHPILGNRLREITQAVLDVDVSDSVELMSSSVDSWKLRSSMTLFDAICPNDIFADVLAKYYSGKRDIRTLRMLGINSDAE